MRLRLAIIFVILGFGGAAVSAGLNVALAAGDHIALVDIDSAIDAPTASYLNRAIQTAEDDGASVVIVTLNTPGGLFDSTRDMVETIFDSSVPIVVYVSPSGARAASAGTFITAAAHVASMAPGTNIGAASPVGIGGEDLPATINKKAREDATAFIRSIADERGRNADALEATVIDAVAYSPAESLESNIIDLIAEDLDDLLAQIDGLTVSLAEGEAVIETTDLEVRSIERTLVESFLSFLADPNVAFLLLSIGSLALFIEIISPGFLGPGVVGVVFLVLGFVSAGLLPVNWVGIGLLTLAMVLFYFEFEAPGVSFFGIAGTVCFVLGAFFLFGGFAPPPIERPSIRVDLRLIAAITLVMLGFLWFVLRDIAAARRSADPGIPEREMLVGQLAVATSDLSPKGTVHVGGEDWSAISDTGETIDEGTEVTVVEAEGLVVRVRPGDYPGPLGGLESSGTD